tara:strand:+ start:424 stop:1143 length:720 start_codon:yes stop_codon:yes gene_type:complete
MSSEQLKQYDARIAEIDDAIAALTFEKFRIVSQRKTIQDVHWKKMEESRTKQIMEWISNDFEEQKTCEMSEYENNGIAKIIEVKEDHLLEEYKNSDDFDYETELTNVNMFQQSICNTINFGDIIDPTGYRHYSYTFVAKDGSLVNTNRHHHNVIDQEFGVTVPFDICKHLSDAVSKYKHYIVKGNEVIVSFELPYHDVTVQKYKVPENHLYEYVFDYDTDIWDLWVIDKDGCSKKAQLK